MVKALGVVILVLLALLGAAGWFITYQADQLVIHKAAVQRWIDEDSRNTKAYEAAMAAANARAQQTEKAHADEIARITAAHESDIAKAKARRARDVADARNGAIRLLVSADSCKARGSGPAEAGAAPRLGDGPATIELPSKVAGDLLELANDADDTADQLRAAQAVITACYAAQKPKDPQ